MELKGLNVGSFGPEDWTEAGLVAAVVDRICCVRGGQLHEVARRRSLVLTL